LPELVFWVSVGVVAYVYFGYPALLYVLARLRPAEVVRDPHDWPKVTLVVSAYNEAGVIEAKIRNALSTGYPTDRLEILIVSDASDDGTDDIVEQYANHGVVLVRMAQRGGKTVGLNEAVRRARGELVLFSDANAMYLADAVRQIVRRFSDPKVGAVVGESTYEDSDSDSDRSEGLYWRYETWIKEQESRIGSVVGGDGAIYAVRKSLYQPMPADALSDFVNPLQVVRAGYRCVYEGAAVSVEKAAGDFAREYRRKVRIVNRAWRATMRLRGMLNPFRHGWFAVQLISHKLLRWWVPVFMIAALTANLLAASTPLYQLTLAGQGAFYGLAGVGWLLRRRDGMPIIVYIPYYFCLVNVASLHGLIDAFRGQTYTTWSTARATPQSAGTSK
jgi:cellulose synthase/poly-beta-1,6-N-acetylglucosamine synthase-like glycosyltransferase